MKYLKIINLLDNEITQTCKFKTKNRVEINDKAHGTYNANGKIESKTTMLKPTLCDYSDAYILVKQTMTVVGQGADATSIEDRSNKQVIFKNCASFTNYVSEENNARVDNAKDINVAVPIYNLIEQSNRFSKA